MAKLRLSDVARRCKTPYQQIYLRVVSGLIPAERTESGSRWLIDEKDLPAIAAQLRQKKQQEDEAFLNQ